MIKRSVLILATAFILLLVTTAVFADGGSYPWKDHAAPFDFKFNNLIDNHQQSKLVGGGGLQGTIYVRFTGEENDGEPVAVRANCEDPTLDCRAGWIFQAVPVSATLVCKGPLVWLVEEDDLPAGLHYSHFHWDGNLAETPYKPCGLKVGQSYDGFLMQRTAVKTFFWLGGNPDKGHGGHLVTPGTDYKSNIVTEWTEGSCSGHGAGDTGGHDDGDTCSHDDGDTCSHDDGDTGDHEDGDTCSHEDGDACSHDDTGSGGPDGSGGQDGGSCGGHDDGF